MVGQAVYKTLKTIPHPKIHVLFGAKRIRASSQDLFISTAKVPLPVSLLKPRDLLSERMSATSTDAKREGRQLRGSRGAQRIQEVMLSTADSDGRVRKTGRRHVNLFNVTRTVDRQSGVLCGVGDGVSTRAGVTSNDSAAAKCNPMRVNQAAPSV